MRKLYTFRIIATSIAVIFMWLGFLNTHVPLLAYGLSGILVGIVITSDILAMVRHKHDSDWRL